MKSVKIRYSANNEVSIQVSDLPYPGRNYGDKEREQSLGRDAKENVVSVNKYLRDNRFLQYRDADGTLWRYDARSGECENPDLTNLTLSANINKNDYATERKHFRTPGWGLEPNPTVFGRSARHRILECGSAFDEVLRRTHQGNFITLTLPGSSRAAVDNISRFSGYLLNIVLQSVRNNFTDPYFFGVWELQKRGALHLHLFVAVPEDESSEDSLDKIRASWYNALEELSNDRGVDFFSHRLGDFCTIKRFWQSDIQPVEKSPAAYFAKYVSKEANAPIGRRAESGNKVRYPSRWWCCSRNFKRLTDSMRLEVCMDAMSEDVCNDLFDAFTSYASSLEPAAGYYRDGVIHPHGNEAIVLGTFKKRIWYFPRAVFGCVRFLVKKWVREVLLALVPPKVRFRYHPGKFEDTHIDEYLSAHIYL